MAEDILQDIKTSLILWGDGENEIEALKDLKETFKGVLEVMLEEGDYIKEPIDNEVKIRINITLPKA